MKYGDKRRGKNVCILRCLTKVFCKDCNRRRGYKVSMAVFMSPCQKVGIHAKKFFPLLNSWYPNGKGIGKSSGRNIMHSIVIQSGFTNTNSISIRAGSNSGFSSFSLSNIPPIPYQYWFLKVFNPFSVAFLTVSIRRISNLYSVCFPSIKITLFPFFSRVTFFCYGEELSSIALWHRNGGGALGEERRRGILENTKGVTDTYSRRKKMIRDKWK